MLDAVNRVKAFKNVLDRVVFRVLAGLDGKTLVTEVLKRNDLRADFVLRQLFAGDVTVFRVIRAVNAAVYAVVREVERREHDDAVAVERELDFLGELIHLRDFLRVLAGEQNGRLAVGQTGAVHAAGGLFRTRLFENAVDEREVVLVLLGILERFENFLVVDKFVRIHGLRVIDSHFSYPFLKNRWHRVTVLRRRGQ